MYYKITSFGACAPYPRLIYWIASSTSQGKKDDIHENPGLDNKSHTYNRAGKIIVSCILMYIFVEVENTVLW